MKYKFKLKDICELYIGKPKISPRVSNKHKLEIEKYIKAKYKNVLEKYKDSSYNGERYKGWVGVQIKEDQ